MKVYPYIVICKDDMTKLEHFKTAEKVAWYLYPKTNSHITDHYIILKNETTVVNLDAIRYYTAMPNDVHKRLITILEQA